MKNECQKFRTVFEEAWAELPDIDSLCEKQVHWKSCTECRDFVSGYRRMAAVLNAADENVPMPDFNQVRMEVWDQIDQRSGRQSRVKSLLKPVVLAPVAAVLLAVTLFLYLQQTESQHLQTASGPALADLDSLVTADYPTDQDLEAYLATEFSTSIDDYFIENSSYSAMDEYFSTADDNWDQMLASLAEQQI